MVRERGTERVSSFRADRLRVTTLSRGREQKWKAGLHFPLSIFYKTMTGSRVKERTVGSEPNGSPTKFLTRRRKWTEAPSGERRAGLLPLTEYSGCAQHCASSFTALDTASVLGFASPSVPRAVCSVNIY